MRAIVVSMALALAAVGCGSKANEDEGPKTRVEMKDLPAPCLQTAQQNLPGITFTEAYLKKDGTYEVRGKDKNGKVREVEVKADGTFIQIE